MITLWLNEILNKTLNEIETLELDTQFVNINQRITLNFVFYSYIDD